MPSTSIWSIIRAQASDTKMGIRHSAPLDSFTSVNSKLFNGTPNIFLWLKCCLKVIQHVKIIVFFWTKILKIIMIMPLLPDGFLIFSPFWIWCRTDHVIHLQLSQITLHYLPLRLWTLYTVCHGKRQWIQKQKSQFKNETFDTNFYSFTLLFFFRSSLIHWFFDVFFLEIISFFFFKNKKLKSHRMMRFHWIFGKQSERVVDLFCFAFKNLNTSIVYECGVTVANRTLTHGSLNALISCRAAA